ELEHDGHVAEGEIQVDQTDPARATGGQGDGQIRCQYGLSAAALGGEHGDDLRVVLRLGAGRMRPWRTTGGCAGPLPLPGQIQRARTRGEDRGRVVEVGHLAYAG